ncbi:hypothetical protein ACVSXV_22375, partial [Yersinia enterocolitica]
YSVEFGAQQNAYVIICGYFAGGDWFGWLGSGGLEEYQVVYGYLSATSSRHFTVLSRPPTGTIGSD